MDLTGNPNVARLRPPLSEDGSREEFEASLETLLDRLELNLSQSHGARFANDYRDSVRPSAVPSWR